MSKSMSRRSFLALMGGSAAVLGLGLVGCGGGSNGSASTSAASGSASTASGSGKKYIVATDTTFAPFEFTDKDNNFVGIDVDLLAAIASEEGFEYDLQSLGFDAAVAALESNQADAVIAGMSITDTRKKKYDFSDPYYESYVCAAAKDGGDVKSLDDLKGKTVAAKTGTQSADWAESIKGDYNLTITYFDQSDMMYQDVQAGNSAACFEDYPVMVYGITQGNGFTIIGEDKDNFASPYAFAVMKGKNSELIEAFNKGLKSLKDSGKYDEIVNKYLKA
ncbi:transporter substrate-binding domain-containing protein [Olsenella uli]|uniref:transporter substrate-binding domain-containing protein n=1 Tax=Olsenella uli TaxID=133926 RepID=UPI0012ABB201|nr:transporter substrate-binding domain-containing protein [Olsenella uli]